jgi:hypothetical protein
MKKALLLALFVSVVSYAQEGLTLRQVMQLVNSATLTMLQGFLLNNDELVVRGAKEIAYHPMPKGGPAQYIDPAKREEFIRMMPTFERLVHGSAEEIIELIKQKKREEAYEKFHQMVKGCMGCHQLFMDFGRK